MPTVIIGNNTGDNYSGTEDSWIDDAVPDNNLGATASFELRNTSGRHSSCLIKFSGLSNISAGVTVSASAIYIRGSNPWESMNYHFRRLLRNWIEGTQDNAACSNDNPDSSSYNQFGNGNAWTTAGALSDGNDRYATASGYIAIGTTAQYYSVSSSGIVADVEDFINGDLNNYGWLVSRDTVDPWHVATCVSSEGTDGQRPYLSVTYESSITGNSYYYQQMQM